MQKITTFLWYNGNAEEAAEFYISVFRNSKIVSYMGPRGRAMGVTFELNSREFIAFNGGPQYSFTPAISIFVSVEDQAEVDELWGKLTANGGREQPCGWLNDRFGLSWQIVPAILPKLLGDKDPGRAQRAMQAMLQMKKLDIATLQQAADQG